MIEGLLITLCALAAPDAVFEEELIFTPTEKHDHGSSIVETPEGDLLTCWFHGSGERTADDVLVQGARKRKGETAWSDVFTMADTPDLPDCNPVLFVDPRGTLWLFWITVQDNMWGGSLLKYRRTNSYAADGPPDWAWQDVVHCRPLELEAQYEALFEKIDVLFAPLLAASEDLKEEYEGLKAATHDKLSRRLGWMTRIHPIVTGEKRLILGLYSDVFNCSLAAITEDWGATWAFSEPILTVQLGNIQPAFVEKKDGTIVAYMRDNGLPKFIRTAESKDGGIRWSDVTLTPIRNPGSSVDCVALENGHWVMICNDTADGRHIISAYLSEDEGATWPYSRRIEDFAPDEGSGSYPSVIEASDGLVHCTYSFREKTTPGSSIKHVCFNEAWIKDAAKGQ